MPGIHQLHRPGAQVDATDQAGDEVLEPRCWPRDRPAPGSSRRPVPAVTRPRCGRSAGSPTHSVAVRAAATPCPIASVRDRCSTSRARLKSNVSPAMPAAGSSQPASVNDPASQVWGPGSSRCWISADRLNGRVRCPHSYRSVCRRLAITTNASRCASRAISARSLRRPVGRAGQLQETDRPPRARSPAPAPARTGSRPDSEPPASAARTTCTCWVRTACSAGPPSNGRTVADSSSAPPLVARERSAAPDPVGGLQLDVREADQGPPRQVGDEERDPRRAERQAQLAGDRLDGLDGRGRLGSGQHAAHGSGTLLPNHVRSLGAAAPAVPETVEVRPSRRR